MKTDSPLVLNERQLVGWYLHNSSERKTWLPTTVFSDPIAICALSVLEEMSDAGEDVCFPAFLAYLCKRPNPPASPGEIIAELSGVDTIHCPEALVALMEKSVREADLKRRAIVALEESKRLIEAKGSSRSTIEEVHAELSGLLSSC